MHFNLVALLGLAALSCNFVVDARALPNDLAQLRAHLSTHDVEAFIFAKTKRAGTTPPVAPKPPTPNPNAPAPKSPTVVVPRPVTPPGAVVPRPGSPPTKPPTQGPVVPKPVTPKVYAPAKKLPTRKEVDDELDVQPDTSMFYAGDGQPGSDYYTKAKNFISAAKPDTPEAKLKVISRMFKRDKDYYGPYDAAGEKRNAAGEVDEKGTVDPKGEKLQKDFWVLASTIMAKKSSGMVYVMLPSDSKGTDFRDGTVWKDTEWPILQRNPKVTMVIRLNPENFNQEPILIRETGFNIIEGEEPSPPSTPTT